jgi:EAL domain-containing protein (putative c-di-GMP-specific phosphodiesterase class I)
LLAPDTFIPLAEDTGLIVPLGRHVVREACLQLERWTTGKGQRRSLSMAVNLSGRQFSHDALAREIADVLDRTSVDPSCLNLEITEGSIVEDSDRARGIVMDLKALGVRLHIDDFGIGYSSLSSLHRFPIDGLKIDRSFIARMGVSDEDLELVRSVMLLAHSLRMEVIAEGVETAEQLAQLRGLRCPYAQGFFLSRPLPADEATALLESGRRW